MLDLVQHFLSQGLYKIISAGMIYFGIMFGFGKKDFKEIEVFSTTATLLGFLVCLSFCLLEDCQFLNYTGWSKDSDFKKDAYNSIWSILMKKSAKLLDKNLQGVN